MRVLGYCRVSTDEQDVQAQREAIRTEAHRRGWTVEWVEDLGYSARTLKRPGIQTALDVLAAGHAEVLIASRVDRLSRSVVDFAGLMARARNEGWSLVVLDLNVDTTTPAGEAMANLLATFAQFERRLISQRTKEALAVKRANGIRLGRPRAVPEDIRERIVRERVDGATLRQIAEGLNRDHVPTVKLGAIWHPATVRSILKQQEA